MSNDLSLPPKTRCREDLKSRILRCDLAPGAELDETRLAAEYGLSRTPLREVFQVLAGQGYLSLQSNRGARVAPLEVETLRALSQAAPLLSAATARLAAQNRTEAQLAALREAQDALSAALDQGDPARAALCDHRFHGQIAEMAGNAYLAEALNRMLVDLVRLGQGLYRPTAKKERKLLRKALQQHEDLVAAIAAQDAGEAVAAALAHWEITHEEITRAMAPAPVPHDIAAQPET